jgi:poly-gamma-glutamate capsule biosynthesis protein CapA/YwtB (metallophosphatase superfamily)
MLPSGILAPHMNRRDFLRQSSGALGAAALATQAGPASAQAKPTLTLALTGDVIMPRRASTLTDPRFLEVARLLQGADCTFGNCEMVIAGRSEGVPSAAGRSLSVVVDPYAADELKWLGYDLMGTANNHSLDYGAGGLTAAGTGVDLQEAAAPRYADTASGRVALVGCASTVAPHAPAVAGRGDFPGVPGVNTIRRRVRYQLPKALLDGVAAAAKALDPVMLTGANFPVPPGVTLMGAAFVEGPTADLLSEPHPADQARLVEAVQVARRNARLVLASIHAHEIYRELTVPDPFVPALAHAAIDAGADVFITHGSHYLAGIEIYKGKPIFYGLGDFFFQYESVRAYAADTYEAYGLPAQATDPSKATDQIPLRGGRLLWETVVPVLEYDGDRLTSLVVHPVTLGMDQPRHARGTPVTASPADADKILDDLTRLSAAYGTRVTKDGTRGRIALA